MSKTERPAGVSWEPSPLLDFGKHPKLSLLPDFVRLITVGHLAMEYGGFSHEDGRASILDAACGYGELYTFFQANRRARGFRYSYVGVDVDDRKQTAALARHKNIDFRLADFEVPGALPLVCSGEKFDVVISTETLEHLSRENGARYLDECYDLLAPGGTFILTSPDPHIRRDNPWHLYEWPREELIEYCRKWNILDQFYLKAPVRELRAKTGLGPRRAPSELLRALPSNVAGSITVLVISKVVTEDE